MKKSIYIIGLSLLINGCSDKEESNPVETLIDPNTSNPTSLLGQYNIIEYMITDVNNKIYTLDTLSDENKKNNSKVNNYVGRGSIEQHGNIFSFTIQSQDFNISSTAPDISYVHTLFPMKPYDIKLNEAFDAVSKATIKGYNSFLLGPIIGDDKMENRNLKINKIFVEDKIENVLNSSGEYELDENGENKKNKRKVLVISIENFDKKYSYVYKLEKVSNKSSFVIHNNGINPQGGTYAKSTIESTPMKFSNNTEANTFYESIK